MTTCRRTSSRPSPRWHERAATRQLLYRLHWPHRRLETEGPVATPNYGYEKRQKELAKKKKKEEKLKDKAARKAGLPGEGEGTGDGNQQPGTNPPSQG